MPRPAGVLAGGWAGGGRGSWAMRRPRDGAWWGPRDVPTLCALGSSEQAPMVRSPPSIRACPAMRVGAGRRGPVPRGLPVESVHPPHEPSTRVRLMHDLTVPTTPAASPRAPGASKGRDSVDLVHGTYRLDVPRPYRGCRSSRSCSGCTRPRARGAGHTTSGTGRQAGQGDNGQAVRQIPVPPTSPAREPGTRNSGAGLRGVRPQ